ncbi:MAG: DUF1553 domain-containing protein, partial [Planctomycetota bacterium]
SILLGLCLDPGEGTSPPSAASRMTGSSGTAFAEEPAGTEQPVAYETQIRPLLKARCWHCHGDEPKLAGGLDLRLARLARTGGESGPAIVPGKLSESLLWQRVEQGEMPPGEKKLSRAELDLLKRWIEQGAKTVKEEPATVPPPGAISEEERSHWAFQPVRMVAPPGHSQPALARTPVDQFLLAELDKQSLTFATEAPRAVLARRTMIDLWGVTPVSDGREEVEEFLRDEAPDAYERWLDRLLAAPRYGERWARHWLDVAGYADSDGYTEADPERKYAYKYRDYVIRSLNADRPWNELIVEQLAGDELLTPPLTNLNATQAELLAATGFLRMGPDGTGQGGVDQEAARNDVIAETIKIVSSSLLGLSVGCAQCHNHRYDPISQIDYYRFRAIFEPAYDVANWRPPAARLVSLWSDAERQRAAEVDAEVKKIGEERSADMEKIIQEILEREVAKLPEELREPARQARRATEKDRTPEQVKLIKEYPSIGVSAGSAYLYDQKRVDEHTKKFNELTSAAQTRKPADDFVPCLTEVPGQIPVTKLFYRGDHKQPREAVLPSELMVLGSGGGELPTDDPAVPTSGRRLAYARHLTNGQHPLLGRVLVNRFWLQHFGRGLVATPADFGTQGERPSHPELLDWLAGSFTGHSPAPSVLQPWQLKSLHRLLMTSTAYRQSSRRSERAEAVDPDNRLLSRMSVRRVEAEVLRDSILSASGMLVERAFGSPVPVAPDDVGMVTVGKDSRDSAGRPTNDSRTMGGQEYRRTIYVQVRRTWPLSMLEAFDAPTLSPNCELRLTSTVAPQSLLLMNNEFLLSQSELVARRVRQVAGEDVNAQVRTAWRLVLCQEPTEATTAELVQFLAEQTQIYRERPAAVVEKGQTAPAKNAAEQALANLCQALLCSNQVLYRE